MRKRKLLLLELDQAIDDAIVPLSQAIARETAPPQDRLVPPHLRTKRIEHELREHIKSFRQKSRDGLQLCLQALSDHGIEITPLKENLRAGFQKLDSKEHAEAIGQQVVSGKSAKELLGITESSCHTLYKGCKVLFDEKRYHEAELAFSFLLLIDHTCFSGWIGLAHASFELQQFDQAINAYNRASSLDPVAFWPHIYIANCLIEKKDFDLALQELETAKGLQSEGEENHALKEALSERIIFVKNKR